MANDDSHGVLFDTVSVLGFAAVTKRSRNLLKMSCVSQSLQLFDDICAKLDSPFFHCVMRGQADQEQEHQDGHPAVLRADCMPA